MSTLFIGLGHYSRTGKDTFANFLLKEIAPYRRVLKRSLAWKLKQVCCELYGWAGVKSPEHYETKEGEGDRDITLPKLGMTPVELWVAFGTKAVRDNCHQETWLRYLLETDLDCDVLVIPDVRFPNEADAIREAGGKLIKIVRPGYGPRDTVADKALLDYDGWDYVIGQTGSLNELSGWANLLVMPTIGRLPWPVQTPEERAAALAVERRAA